MSIFHNWSRENCISIYTIVEIISKIERCFFFDFSQEDEEEPSSVHYYSTAPQFYELICRMDPKYYEYDLCIFFLSKISSIMEQVGLFFIPRKWDVSRCSLEILLLINPAPCSSLFLDFQTYV